MVIVGKARGVAAAGGRRDFFFGVVFWLGCRQGGQIEAFCQWGKMITRRRDKERG